jgi:hypothetical protein
MTFSLSLSAKHDRVLVSSFAQDNNMFAGGPPVSIANTISFKRTLCTINTDDGRYLFTESSEIEAGLLDQTTLFLSAADRGKMKDVYGASDISLECLNFGCSNTDTTDDHSW